MSFPLRFRAAFLCVLASLALSVESYADQIDGWQSPVAGTEAISFADALVYLKQVLGVEAKSNRLQVSGSWDTTYSVLHIRSGSDLGSIPIPKSAEEEKDGRFLKMRALQLLKTPVTTLAALTKAEKDFYNDAEELESELGISAYVPNVYPLHERTKQRGTVTLVYVTLEEHATPRYFEMPSVVYKGLKLRGLEYFPGREDYLPELMYQPGDLKRAILRDSELMAEIKKRVSDNAQHSRLNKRKWRKIERKLNGESLSMFGTFLASCTALLKR